MTVRSPLRFADTSPNIATGDTYEFYGVEGNISIRKTNLRRYTLSEANALIPKLDLSAFSSAGITVPSNFNSYDIGMDGQPDGGYIFMETQDDSGNAVTPWRPWWPKNSNRNLYYQQPASNNVNNYQFPGNFIPSVVRGYYSIDVRNQILQEESKVDYVIGSIIDTWLKSLKTHETATSSSSTPAPAGVELRLNHQATGKGGYTVYNQQYGNTTSWSNYGNNVRLLNLNTHIGISSPGSTATLHPTKGGAGVSVYDTRYRSSSGISLTSGYGACQDPPDLLDDPNAYYRFVYVMYKNGELYSNYYVKYENFDDTSGTKNFPAWIIYHTYDTYDYLRTPEKDGMEYWLSVWTALGHPPMDAALRGELKKEFDRTGGLYNAWNYCDWQQLQGVDISGGDPPQSQIGYVQEVTEAYTTLDQWVQTDTVYSGYQESLRPLYVSNTGELRAMTDADIDDTFIKPAIQYIMGEKTFSGINESLIPYTITTSSSSPTNYTRLRPGGNASSSSASNAKIFQDTIARVSSYNNNYVATSDFGADYSTTVTEYWMHKKNSFASLGDLASSNYNWVRFDSSSNSLVQVTSSQLAGYLVQRFNHVIATTPSWRIRYTLHLSNSSSSSSYSKQYAVPTGTTMTDTSTKGRQDTRSYIWSADDYRWVNVPTGSASTVNTYRLYAARY